MRATQLVAGWFTGGTHEQIDALAGARDAEDRTRCLNGTCYRAVRGRSTGSRGQAKSLTRPFVVSSPGGPCADERGPSVDKSALAAIDTTSASVTRIRGMYTPWHYTSSVTESARDATANVDHATVNHFGTEWTNFTQAKGWGAEGLDKVFARYFAPLPNGALHPDAIVGDFGAGSGRWAVRVAPLVAHLYVLEPSPAAMSVARRNLALYDNVTYVTEPIGGPSIPTRQLDVAYSLGVIHHVPDALRALRDVRKTLKPGGIFLGYLYYALENRPRWFRAIWRASDIVRAIVSRLPPSPKSRATNAAALLVYWPLARTARLLSKLGVPAVQFPLSQYADKSFYVMRNDALDRLGTPLEQRFTRPQISEMLRRAGFDVTTLKFSEREPFWCFSVRASIDVE